MSETYSIIEEKFPIYAVDTNIVISMSYIDCYGYNGCYDARHKRYYNQIEYLMKLAENGEVGLVVPPTVKEEINYRSNLSGNKLIQFAKKGLFLEPKLKSINSTKYKSMVETIAGIYARSLPAREVAFLMKDKKTYQYNPFLSQSVFPLTTKNKPINDAFVMAQAATLRVPLVTADLKDFIKFSRPQKISYKNTLMGLPEFATAITPASAYNYLEDNFPKNLFQTDQKDAPEFSI